MTTATTYREKLLKLADRLSITDDEAGEPEWAAYLNDAQLEAAILRLRPEARVIAGDGDDRESGVLDSFSDGMAVVRWEQGVVTQCPVDSIEID